MRKKLLSILLLVPFVFGVGFSVYRPSTQAQEVSLLKNPWHLQADGGASEAKVVVNPTILSGASSVQITYDLHGLCALSGDASAIIFDQNGWKYVALSDVGQNCRDGTQTVTIPLSSFKDIISGQALDPNVPLTGKFHVRFWYYKPYTVDITSVKLLSNASLTQKTYPTATPTLTSVQATPTPSLSGSTGVQSGPTPTQVQTSSTPLVTTLANTSGTFPIQSIDAMKDTKDAICGQRPLDWINKWLDKAVELGANYVAISTPYDNPSCGDALAYTKTWVKAIRAHNMHVWHRHMPLSFEGIYSVNKNNSSNYLDMISNYIKNNPDIFENGDIFTPIPEPQNGGIQGITYCANSICQFTSAADFNQWLRDAMTTSQQAFQSINKSIKIGYFGFDGFVAWGDKNPDWHGILEDSTVSQMGNITIDHYPETVGETMDQALTALQAKYPTTPIVIGEYGTVNGQNVDQEVQDTMTAAKNHNIVGFNYWQFGPSGSGEQLINDDFSNRSDFSTVESFYKAQ